MMSSNFLFQIHRRLCQVYGSNLPFGGISILAVGDFNQLRPVAGSFPFAPRSDSISLLASDINPLWDGFQIFELDQIMRQKDDLRFAEALNRLAVGRLTESDVQLFKTRCFTEETLPPHARKALRVMSTNAAVDHYNNLRINLLILQKPVNINFIAQDSVVGNAPQSKKVHALAAVKNMKKEDTKNLLQELHLVVGIMYMVSCNINVEDGLFNGANGTLRFIEFNSNRSPEAVYIEFTDPKIGAIARQDRKSIMDQLVRDGKIQSNYTPIMRTRQTFNVTKRGALQICRTQYPLIPAEAITIYKSQGMSVDCLVTPGGKLERTLMYVAYSRAKTLAGLFIMGEFVPPSPRLPTHSVSREMQRLRANHRYTPKFQHLRKPNESIQIASFNIQSLRKHISSVPADHIILNCEVILFQETWLVTGEILCIEGYTEVIRNFSTRPTAQGTIIFTRTPDEATEKQYAATTPPSEHIGMTACMYKGIMIINVYRSPKSNWQTFKTVLQENKNWFNNSNVLLCGDFNDKTLRDEESTLRTYLKTEFGLDMISPCESTTDGDTTIDAIFGKLIDYTYDVTIYESFFSYHKPIIIKLNKA